MLAALVLERQLGEAVVAASSADATALLQDGRLWAGILVGSAHLDALARARAGAHPLTPALLLVTRAEIALMARALKLRAFFFAGCTDPLLLLPFLRFAGQPPPKLDAVVQACKARHHLTAAETDLLRHAFVDDSFKGLAKARGRSALTIKAQVASLRLKTGVASLHALVESLLGEAARA